MELKDLVDKIKDYLPADKLTSVEEAYHFAELAHAGQLRESGEPYIQHPLQTALTLAELHLDAPTVAAGLLHDVVEDCGVPLSQVQAQFGPEIATLVDGITKLSQITWQASDKGLSGVLTAEDASIRAENLRKMLVAMAQDIRVVLIKLADRLHNMRTLGALSRDKQLVIAQETMDVYAPLAHRLGIWDIKWQLEDLSFRYLQPERYREVAGMVAQGRRDRERYIANVIELLKRETEKAGITAEISGRPKHIYSIHTKLQRYAPQGRNFAEIYDLLALRVLVDDVPECYGALGAIHNLWRPLPGQFDDYIASPKNGIYQSLHTTVMGPGGKPLEIQIRSREMHRIAEYGVAAHWRYKEGAKRDMQFEEKMTWLRQLVEWKRELAGAEEFVESVKTDIFQDQVFVFTPKGEIKELPAGATPLDFAYRIHTELGHRCSGAKVNGRMVPLDYQLRNGQVVDILATKAGRGPSLDWLNPNLGYVKTSHAREKIRQWFNKQEHTQSVHHGREILAKELRRLGVPLSDQEDIARLFKYEDVDDLYFALGSGMISGSQIAMKLAAQQEPPPAPIEAVPLAETVSSGIEVLGIGNLLTRIARCCNPVPGDEIVGFVTRGRGISVHRRDCYSVLNEEEKERLIPVDWGRRNQIYPVAVRIDAWDRVGLIRDVTTIVSAEKVNILGLSTNEHTDHTTTITLTLETTGIEQLSLILAKVEGVRGVFSVSRSMDGAKR